jgi:phenylalanyl-tRNA synthetase beta chain
MRQTLVPGLLENALFNARRGSKSVHLFEIGTVFMGPSEQGKVPNTQILSGTANQDSWADERIHLGTLMFGVHGLHAFDVKKTSVDFYDLKGVLEEFFAGLMLSNDHVSSQMHFEKPHAPPVFMHPGMVANVIFKRDSKSKNVVIGFIGQIHPDVQKAYELDEPAYVFELDLRMLKELAQEYRIMKPIAKFPSVQRDLALLLSDDVMAGDLIDTIVAQDALSELLADIEIFDVYRGDKIPAGKKSLAISLTLRAQERTLTDDEVAGLMEPLVKNLHDKLGAVIR